MSKAKNKVYQLTAEVKDGSGWIQFEVDADSISEALAKFERREGLRIINAEVDGMIVIGVMQTKEGKQ